MKINAEVRMDRIRQLRNERGLSQVKLAVMADMDPATLNRLERGTGNPNLKTLERVAEALGVEVADFFPKAPGRSSREPSLFNGLEDERRRTFVQKCRQYAESRAQTYEVSSATLTQDGGVYAGAEGARILFVEAYDEYRELHPFVGRDLAYMFVEGLSDYEAERFSGLALLAALRPLAETVERLADRAEEVAETEAQKAEVERRRKAFSVIQGELPA